MIRASVRFLHTADWHVGKPLRGRSRLDEFAAALDEVAGIAAERRVDAVLVAGDVFDSPAPPPEAERLVYDFLARLVREGIACVVIAGNHDHPRKFQALAELLAGLRIHVRSEVRPAGEGGVVRLASRDGREEARVAALPFIPERRIVDACQVMEPSETWYAAYAERVAQILARLTRGLGPDTVNVVVGHLLVSGARAGTGERPLHLGEVYGVNAQQLPRNAQYIALGHLHRPQQLDAPAPAYYSGSLIELDFGEKEQDKRVLVFEAAPGGAAAVESVPLRSGRRLRDLTGTLAEVLAAGRETPGDYLRVRVRVEAPVPGIAEQVREALPQALDVSLAYERRVWEPPAAGSRASLAPRDLFTAFYRARNEAEPPAELLQLFERIHEEALRS